MKTLNYTHTFRIVGRGTVFATDLLEEQELSIGETVLVDGDPRTIFHIESINKRSGPIQVGVILEQLSNVENKHAALA